MNPIDDPTPSPPPAPVAARRPAAVWGMLWILAIALSAFADRPVADAVHARGWDDKPHWSKTTKQIVFVSKLPGEYLTIVAAAIAVGVWHRRHWLAAATIALSGAVSGINGMMKWIVGRHRPVAGIHPFDLQPFVGGLRGLLSEKNLCFPSGHAALAFAAAAALGICIPRWRVVFFLLAAVTGIERIVENAHYVSDVTAAAGLGILSAYVVTFLVERWHGNGTSPESSAPTCSR